MKHLKIIIAILGLVWTVSAQSQITINFCPVSKTQALPKGFNATIEITNNTGIELDFANNDFTMEWPSLISLPWPFSDGVQTGVSWDFKLNLDWPGTIPNGATKQLSVGNSIYSGVLQFPTDGTYTEGGTTYTVTVNHCNKTDAFELYDATVEFNRDCFISSPTSNMCLGEGASEIWRGEGVFDAMIPTDRPSWAIGTMVAHRLFTNMAGVEMLSPNFWTATALNESRMQCDPTIVPNVNNHWPINSMPTTGTGVSNVTNNCFQVLNIGYSQIEDNQPDLFAQTNQYGTASYNNVVDGGNYETGLIAVAYYHYQDIQYWNQIFCWNAQKFHKDAVDPYAAEKVFYHAYHDGPNAGISLLTDINNNYNAAMAATNMNTVITTGGTWSALQAGGNSQKVGNLTSMLDGGAHTPYPYSKDDETTEFYGCYEKAIKWTDITFYFDRVKILYPQLMDAPVQAAIKAVFDGLNGGGDVMFTNLGPVIDEIVIQMGGHDPSSYLATQFSASKVCPGNPLGVSLRTNDTLCPGESGFLQVWLAGDPNFRVDIRFPDGSTNSYTGISSSPYNIAITQPGDYEVVYFEDDDEVGDINCNFAKITVESKNGSVVGWDKTNLDAIKNCANGDLIVTKAGDEQVTISYTKDGAVQTDIVMTAIETTKTIASTVVGGTYIITTISPNSCGVPINDTLTFCDDACTKPPYTILTPDTSICAGDTAQVRISFTGTQPYTLYFTPTGLPQVTVAGITTDFYNIPVSIGGTVTIDSLKDNTCTNDAAKSLTITLNALPIVGLGADPNFCADDSVTFDAGNSGSAYLWSSSEITQTLKVKTAGTFNVAVTDANGCIGRDTVTTTINALPVVALGTDQTFCADDSVTFDAGNVGSTYLWVNTETTQTIKVKTAGTYSVIVTDVNGCKGLDTVESTINVLPAVALGDDQTICAGDSVTFDAGNAGSNYLWNTTATSQTVKAKVIGSYSVIVTDANGCNGRGTVELGLKGAATVNLGNDTTICGTSLELDAGTQTTYLWQENATNSTQTFIASTTGLNEYRVEVTNAEGCISRDSINVTLNPKPVFNFSPSDSVFACPTSFPINLDATTASATYEWSDASTNPTLNVNTQGDYWVIVTVTGCSDTDSVYVKESSTLSLDLRPDTTVCPGQPITLSPVINYSNITYTWSDGTGGTSLTTTTTGKIYLDIEDAGGCAGTDTMELFNENPLTIDLGTDKTECFGDTATLELTPAQTGLNYDWELLATTVSTDSIFKVWTAGSATFTLNVDSAGCTATDDIIVTINALPIVSLGPNTFVCTGAGATIALDANNVGSTYLWNDASFDQTLQVSTAGDYDVIVTDGNGCIAKDTMTLTEKQATVFDLGDDQTICPAGSAKIDVPSTPASVLTTGSYVWEDATSVIQYTVANQADGYTEKVKLTYTNEFGCVFADSLTVKVDNVLLVTGLDDKPLCEGESFTEFDTDFKDQPNRLDYSYVWHDGSAGTNFPVNNVTLAQDGLKILVIVTDDVLGCTGKDSAILSVNPLPIPVLRDTSTCLGIPVTINSGPTAPTHTFSWKKNTSSITNSSAATLTIDGLTAGVDTYEVTVTVAATTCSATASADVTTNALPVVDLGSPTEDCEGTTVTLPVNGGMYNTATHSYVWSLNGAPVNGETANTYSASVDGTYKLTVTEIATSCSDSTEAILDFIAKPDIDITISAADTIICVGKTASLEASELNSKYSYNWYLSTDVNDKGIEVSDPLDEGRLSNVELGGYYTLIVTPKLANCPDTATTMVTVRELPISTVQSDSVVCFEEMKDGFMTLNTAPMNINSVTPTYSFLWSTGDTTQIIDITKRGQYTVLITDEEGCVGEGEVLISEDCMPNVWMASGFTPNGDGKNETWGIEGRGIQSMELFVYNRWGEQIWKSTSISEKWDGRFGSYPVQEDVYVWVLSYTFLNVMNNEESRSQTGTLTVVR